MAGRLGEKSVAFQGHMEREAARNVVVARILPQRGQRQAQGLFDDWQRIGSVLKDSQYFFSDDLQVCGFGVTKQHDTNVIFWYADKVGAETGDSAAVGYHAPPASGINLPAVSVIAVIIGCIRFFLHGLAEHTVLL